MSSRSHHALPITLLVTVIVAALPADWRLGWSRDLSEIVLFPLRPFTHAGNTLAAWLRPPPSIVEGTGVELEDLTQLQEDLERAQRLYHNERQRVLELQEQLEQLKQIPRDAREAASAAVFAYITARNPASPLGVVELKLEPGVRVQVDGQTIALYASVDLLGRIIGEPTRTSCSLLPITNRQNDYLRGLVFPREDPLLDPADAPPVLLAPTGAGTFTADVDRLIVIEEGDLVRLEDDAWPRTAQMMVLGVVESIKPNDQEPLRNRIVVRPRYQVQQVAYVTLILERPEERRHDEAAP